MGVSCEKLPERWRDKIARDGHGLIEQRQVAPEDASREHLLMNLRLAEGLDLADYRARWDRDIASERVTPLIEEGLLRQDAERLTVTPRGRLVLNAVIAAISD